MRRKKSEKGNATTTAEGNLLTASASEQHDTARDSDRMDALPPEQAAQEPRARHETNQEGNGKEYPPEPNPRPWTTRAKVGVEFRTRREPYQAELVFKEKPPQRVIDHIKAKGFQWNREGKYWWRPIGFKTGSQDRLVATRTLHEVTEMILEEKGLAPSKETARA
jgi:hypothetical protein